MCSQIPGIMSPLPCPTHTLMGLNHLHGLLMSWRDGDGDVQPVRALRPNALPERSWGTARGTPQEEPQFSALFEAIHVVGKFHTDCTRSTEGPAHQSERLSCPGEPVSLKVDKATFWEKKGTDKMRNPQMASLMLISLVTPCFPNENLMQIPKLLTL